MSIIDYSEQRYYRHTGRAPIVGTTIAALAAWATAAALAVGYAYVDLYAKVHEVIAVLIVFVFAAAGGFAIYGVLRWGKVRNLPVATLVAVSSALLLFYGSWVMWETELARQAGAASGSTPWRLFQRPDAVWRIALRLNRHGTFSLRDSAVTGFWLWILWVGEALILIGTTIAIPVLMLRNAAFCEQCGTWCKTKKDVARVHHFDEELVREHMEEKDFEYLIRLGAAVKTTPIHFRVDLQTCPRCGNTNLLTVSRVKISYHNGQPQEWAKKVVDRLWIDVEQAQAIRALPEQLSATAKLATDEGPDRLSDQAS